MTARLGTRDRLLMRLSVIPSARYSVSGFPLALTKGRIAIESVGLPGRLNQYKPARQSRTTTTAASEMAALNQGREGAGAGWWPPESLRFFRSIRSSRADW